MARTKQTARKSGLSCGETYNSKGHFVEWDPLTVDEIMKLAEEILNKLDITPLTRKIFDTTVKDVKTDMIYVIGCSDYIMDNSLHATGKCLWMLLQVKDKLNNKLQDLISKTEMTDEDTELDSFLTDSLYILNFAKQNQYPRQSNIFSTFTVHFCKLLKTVETIDDVFISDNFYKEILMNLCKVDASIMHTVMGRVHSYMKFAIKTEQTSREYNNHLAANFVLDHVVSQSDEDGMTPKRAMTQIVKMHMEMQKYPILFTDLSSMSDTPKWRAERCRIRMYK